MKGSQGETTAAEWRRRERGLTLGVILWTIGVGIAVSVAPHAVGEWLVSATGTEVVSTIMISIGICGGVGHGTMLLLMWFYSPEQPELTEGWNDG